MPGILAAMSDNLNPQREQMAHESMVRNLTAQAEAIWPQELPLLRRRPLPAGARILDAGCGTGEITRRLADEFATATVIGIDVLDAHLELGRQRTAAHGRRVQFQHDDIFALSFADATFDLVVCRHVLQAIPHADRAIAELVRVTRPGGTLHLLVEDYGMIHVAPAAPATERFWREGPVRYAAATGSSLFIGREALAIAHRLGLRDLTMDYLVVDNLRVPREVFARIWEAWRDGYAESIAEHTGQTLAEQMAIWNDSIAAVRDPGRYAVWHVPVLRAQKP